MKIIEVVCLVVPTGENLWFKTEQGHDYMVKVMDKWREEHPEFKDTICNMGAVIINMPEENYNKIACSTFVFP